MNKVFYLLNYQKYSIFSFGPDLKAGDMVSKLETLA
jgi:hypothetical protein